MMDGAGYAAMSDPAVNRQFRRRWEGPADPWKRERRPAGNGTAHLGKSNICTDEAIAAPVDLQGPMAWGLR